MSDRFENKGAFAATIVVAASDSLKKRSANFVCDGTGDETEIQAAINALPRAAVVDEGFNTGPFAIFDNMDDPISGGGPYTWLALQGDETLVRDAGDMHEGAASLRIDGLNLDYPGCTVAGLASLDWSAYNVIELWAKADTAIQIRLTLYDSAGAFEIFHAKLAAAATWEDLEFNLEFPAWASGILDWTDIVQIDIEARTTAANYTFAVDYFRLNTWVQLDHSGFIAGSVVITDNGTTFIEGTDYEVNYGRGKIKSIVEGGGMVSGNPYLADYSYNLGGRVLLLEGTFNTTAQIELPTRVELCGMGRELTRIVGSGAGVHYRVITNNDWAGGNADITIRDMTIDGAWAASAGTHQTTGGALYLCKLWESHIDNIEVLNGPIHTFELCRSQRITISNSIFRLGRGDDCLSISDGYYSPGGSQGTSETRHIVVENCYAYEPLGVGSCFEVDDGPQHVTFVNCTAWRRAPGDDPNEKCFDMGHNHTNEIPTCHIIVRGCTAYWGRISGGMMADVGDNIYSRDMSVLDCKVYGSNIALWGATQSRIIDCYVQDSNSNGILVNGALPLNATYIARNCLIKGNTVINPTNHGIEVDYGTEGTVIADNYLEQIPFTAGMFGIYLVTGAAGDIIGCVIRGNRINTFQRGIAISASTAGLQIRNVWITENHVYNYSGTALYFNSVANADVRDVHVYKNYLGAGTLILFTPTGVFLYDFHDNPSAMTIALGNLADEKKHVKVYNPGAQVVGGDVIAYLPAASGYQMTTTAILGDDKVLGIAAETIANASFGMILVEGKTTVLNFVADQGAIAIGDFLTCNNVAKEAAKAVAGDMVFAIALEASAADTALDALLIKPRKL